MLHVRTLIIRWRVYV